MSTSFNNISKPDNLIFYMDHMNSKSWKGKPTTNLLYDSGVINWNVSNLDAAITRTTLIANQRYRITSTTGGAFRLDVPLAKLTNNLPYCLSYKFKIISGATFQMNDWCDTALTSNTTTSFGSYSYSVAHGTRSVYDSTFRFMDFTISANTVVEIWDVQLEQATYASPFVVGVRANTESIRDMIGGNTITSTVRYDSVGMYTFNTDAVMYFPENSPFNLQEFTIEVWAKTNNLSQNGFFFEKGQVNTQYSLFQQSASILFRRNYGGLTDMSFNSSLYFTTANWFQLVATHRPGEQRVYANTQLAASNTNTGTIATNTNGCSIGAYGGFNGSRSYFYNGEIGVVKVYNKFFSQDDVNRNFNSMRRRYGI